MKALFEKLNCGGLLADWQHLVNIWKSNVADQKIHAPIEPLIFQLRSAQQRPVHFLDGRNHVIQIALGVFRADSQRGHAIIQIKRAWAARRAVLDRLSSWRIEGGPSRMWNDLLLY